MTDICSSIVCSVRGPPGHFLTFSLVRLELPVRRNCSDGRGDYLQVVEANMTEPVLAPWCGTAPQPPLDTFGPEVILPCMYHVVQ